MSSRLTCVGRMSNACPLEQMLPPRAMAELYRMERSPVGRSDGAWLAVSFMLYGETGGFIAQQRYTTHTSSAGACARAADAAVS